MKKLLFALVLLAVTTFTTNAQVAVLDKTISDTIVEAENSDYVFNSGEIVFLTSKGELTIYDANYNLIKTLNSSIFPSDGDIAYISKNIFTADGKYEVTMETFLRKDTVYYNGGTNWSTRYIYGYKVYNETGSLLFDFGEYRPNYWGLTGLEGYAMNKLATRKEVTYPKGDSYGYGYLYKIYTLPNYVPYNGTNGGGSAITPKMMNNAKKSRSYPNPTNSNITIEYNISGTALQPMEIINMNGQTVETVLVNPAETAVNVNAARYAPGTYVYQIGATSGKFIVK